MPGIQAVINLHDLAARCGEVLDVGTQVERALVRRRADRQCRGLDNDTGIAGVGGNRRILVVVAGANRKVDGGRALAVGNDALVDRDRGVAAGVGVVRSGDLDIVLVVLVGASSDATGHQCVGAGRYSRDGLVDTERVECLLVDRERAGGDEVETAVNVDGKMADGVLARREFKIAGAIDQ